MFQLRGIPGFPEAETSRDSNNNAQQRGIIIHRILQLLTQSMERAHCRNQIEQQFKSTADTQLLDVCWKEAELLIDNPQFAYLFDPQKFDKAYNEVPIQFQHGRYRMHGIIDRLVVNEDAVFIVDYKTAKVVAGSAAEFSPQMSIYYHGVRQVWPDKSVTASVLYTHGQTIVDIEPRELDELVIAGPAEESR